MGGVLPRLSTDETCTLLGLVVETQGNLGWNSFIKGHVSHYWCMLQACYSNTLPNVKAFDSKTQTTKLIKAVWMIFVDVWNAQNAHLHTEMECATNSVLDKQVKKAYALKHSMFYSDRLFFQVPLAEQLQLSLATKKLWLESVRIAVHHFTVVHNCTLTQCVMTDYFCNKSTRQDNANT
eukprot:5761030-Ditylum_brightwellii.AAC.1